MKIQPIRLNVGRFLAALFFVLPFLIIGGESAFRFDVPTLRFHVFGVELWMQEFFLVLLAVMLLVALFLLLTLVYGRFWCGWACPQTVFTDITGFMDRLSRKSLLAKSCAHLLLLAFSLSVGFVSVCYFVSPYEAIPALLSGNLGPVALGSTIVIGLLTYVDFAFIRRTFCATICPYGKIQGALIDTKSLLIQLDPNHKDECIDCKMCVHACPMELDIRKGMQVGCIMCARCVDACKKVMSKKGEKSLVNYSYGVDDVQRTSELIRPGIVALGLVCLLAFGSFVYKTTARSSFDFSILPHPMEARLTKEGDVMNAYILSIKNKRQEEISLTFEIQPEAGITIPFSHNISESLQTPASLVDKFPLFVRSQGIPVADLTLEVTLKTEGATPESRTKSVYFNLP